MKHESNSRFVFTKTQQVVDSVSDSRDVLDDGETITDKLVDTDFAFPVDANVHGFLSVKWLCVHQSHSGSEYLNCRIIHVQINNILTCIFVTRNTYERE